MLKHTAAEILPESRDKLQALIDMHKSRLAMHGLPDDIKRKAVTATAVVNILVKDAHDRAVQAGDITPA